MFNPFMPAIAFWATQIHLAPPSLSGQKVTLPEIFREKGNFGGGGFYKYFKS